MTGRNLETQTVGIAYISGLCSAEFGTSLSQSGLDTMRAALIAAHEIGHNFGAPHDGEGNCATTPTVCHARERSSDLLPHGAAAE